LPHAAAILIPPEKMLDHANLPIPRSVAERALAADSSNSGGGHNQQKTLYPSPQMIQQVFPEFSKILVSRPALFL
jgi:hypothetical protein